MFISGQEVNISAAMPMRVRIMDNTYNMAAPAGFTFLFFIMNPEVRLPTAAANTPNIAEDYEKVTRIFRLHFSDMYRKQNSGNF